MNRGSTWVRRTHALVGIISACNLLLLICTGFLLQHATLLKLDERSVSRRFLPSRYRQQDGDDSVRADIVVADLHSGRIFGVAGALVLDGITVGWLALLCTGVVMYSLGRARNGRKQAEVPDDDAGVR